MALNEGDQPVAPVRAPQTPYLPQALNRPAGTAARGRRRAVFLDKDGTLVENLPYNADPARLRFTPHALEALTLLCAFDYTLVVVTNQPGVALGRFDPRALGVLEQGLRELLGAAGIHLAGFYACPHAPAADPAFACPCRKPAPGLLLAAAEALDIDLARSWMVGDILDDIEAGRRAGCRTLLVDVGHETEWRYAPQRVPHGRVRDLFDAARRIVASDLERTETGSSGRDDHEDLPCAWTLG